MPHAEKLVPPLPIAAAVAASTARLSREQRTLAALLAVAAVHPDAEHVGHLADGDPWIRAPSAHAVATCVDPATLPDAVGVIYARVPFEGGHARVYSTACVDVGDAFEAHNARGVPLVEALRAAAYAQ